MDLGRGIAITIRIIRTCKASTHETSATNELDHIRMQRLNLMQAAPVAILKVWPLAIKVTSDMLSAVSRTCKVTDSRGFTCPAALMVKGVDQVCPTATIATAGVKVMPWIGRGVIVIGFPWAASSSIQCTDSLASLPAFSTIRDLDMEMVVG